MFVAEDLETAHDQFHFKRGFDFFDLGESVFEYLKFVFEIDHLVRIIAQASEDVFELNHVAPFVDELSEDFDQDPSKEVVIVVKLESQIELVLKVFPYLITIL